MINTSTEISKQLMGILIVVLVGFLAVTFIPLGDSFIFSPNSHVIELNSNAYYFWNTPFDLQTLNPRIGYLFLLSAIASICWYLALGSIFQVSVFMLFLSCVNGVTVTSLSILASVGVLIHSHNLSYKNKSSITWVISLIIAITVGIMSQQITPWAVLICAAFIYTNSEIVSKTWIISSSIAIILGLFLSNLPDSLNLPINAVFVPGYNYIYGVDPLIGSQPERVFINKIWIANRLTIVAIITFASLLFIRSKSRHYYVTWSLLILLILQSSIVPDWISVIAPISALSRNIPNAMLFPITLIFGSFFPIFMAKRVNNSDYFKQQFVISIGCLYLMIFSPVDNLFGSMLSPKISDSKLLLTPSLYLTKNKLPTPPEQNVQIIPVNEQTSHIKASHNQDKVNQIYLNKNQTRWSTKPTSQSGNEWLEVHLNTAVKNLRGIELSNPSFIGDYPRGIEVYIGQSNGQSCESLTLAYKEPWWRGSVENLPNGIRYLTTQNIIKLYFTQSENPLPTNQEYSCIQVKQTGSDPFYEWSVQTFKLLIAE